MSLILAADAAGILERAVEIVADMSDSPTRQIRAGERWIQTMRREQR